MISIPLMRLNALRLLSSVSHIRIRLIDHLDIRRANSLIVATGNPILGTSLMIPEQTRRQARNDIIGMSNTKIRALS